MRCFLCARPRLSFCSLSISGQICGWAILAGMKVQRMDNVGIIVDDLDAVIGFFVELGLELEGKAPIAGDWVDRLIALDGVQVEMAMLRTPDRHSRIELSKFHRPAAICLEPKNEPVNTLGIRRLMFAVEDIEEVLSRLRARGRRTHW
jgi:catechol 2,3-dioxygenase-like lactoylglutathione lyase family enzyme